jgi:hypothetical protein
METGGHDAASVQWDMLPTDMLRRFDTAGQIFSPSSKVLDSFLLSLVSFRFDTAVKLVIVNSSFLYSIHFLATAVPLELIPKPV